MRPNPKATSGLTRRATKRRDEPSRLCAMADLPKLKSGPGVRFLGGEIRRGKLKGEKYRGGAAFFVLATVVVVVDASGAEGVVCACLFSRRLRRGVFEVVSVAGL